MFGIIMICNMKLVGQFQFTSMCCNVIDKKNKDIMLSLQHLLVPILL